MNRTNRLIAAGLLAGAAMASPAYAQMAPEDPPAQAVQDGAAHDASATVPEPGSSGTMAAPGQPGSQPPEASNDPADDQRSTPMTSTTTAPSNPEPASPPPQF